MFRQNLCILNTFITLTLLLSLYICLKLIKMRLFIILCFTVLSCSKSFALDWGKKGHRTTGAIAEQYLTKKTKRAIDKLLDGQSLALVSTFADDIKSDNTYRSYGPWHYVNVPFDKTYNTHPHSEKGDLIQGIDTCIKILKSKESSKKEKAFHLKLLVHFIGDLHQPLHTGIADDKGGNDFQVQWFNEGTNLHSIWDTKMIESYGMSYTELTKEMPKLSKSKYKTIASGTHRDWMEGSRTLVKELYKQNKKGDKLSYRYMYDHFETLKQQLQKGGIRLAFILNNILG